MNRCHGQLSGKLLFCNRRCEPTCPTLCVSVPFHTSAHSGQSKPDSVSAALGIPSIALIVLHVPSWETDSRYFFCGGFRMATNIKISQALPEKRLCLRGQSLSLLCVLWSSTFEKSSTVGVLRVMANSLWCYVLILSLDGQTDSMWLCTVAHAGFPVVATFTQLREPEGAADLSDHHVIVTDCWMCGGTVLAMRSTGPCSVAPEQPPTCGRLLRSS